MVLKDIKLEKITEENLDEVIEYDKKAFPLYDRDDFLRDWCAIGGPAFSLTFRLLTQRCTYVCRARAVQVMRVVRVVADRSRRGRLCESRVRRRRGGRLRRPTQAHALLDYRAALLRL